jgi:hypothetical protein
MPYVVKDLIVYRKMRNGKLVKKAKAKTKESARKMIALLNSLERKNGRKKKASSTKRKRS